MFVWYEKWFNANMTPLQDGFEIFVNDVCEDVAVCMWVTCRDVLRRIENGTLCVTVAITKPDASRSIMYQRKNVENKTKSWDTSELME